jgi:hypothetical protein
MCYDADMPTRQKPNHHPGHADPEEYQRFLDVAKKVGASDDPKDFDEAFDKIAPPVIRESSGRDEP